MGEALAALVEELDAWAVFGLPVPEAVGFDAPPAALEDVPSVLAALLGDALAEVVGAELEDTADVDPEPATPDDPLGIDEADCGTADEGEESLVLANTGGPCPFAAAEGSD